MKLDFQNVSVTMGKTHILKNVNFSIPDCSSLMLLGPSGGGKSTLLRVIAGLVIPDDGEVHLDGTLIPKNEKDLVAYRKSIGTVFQSWNLFPHLTTLENISLPLYRVQGLSLQEANLRAEELLTRFGLENHMDRYPSELSGGQSQRVAIVRAVAIHPKLLLFDEPTSALDPIMTSEVLDLIAELKEAGIDFILVSHHLSFAKRTADYVVFIANGEVIEVAAADTFFKSPQHLEAKSFLAKVLKY